MDDAAPAALGAGAARSITDTLNERHVTPELAIDLYVNGWYFHDDPDKRELLETLTVGHGQILTRWVFLDALRAAITHVLIVAEVARNSLADGSLSS